MQDLNRREFIHVGVSVGFALAVSPITAFALNTPEEGVIAEKIEIPVGSERMPGYWAMPRQGSGPFPVVLVVQEIFGVHAHIQDICRRLAHQGYLAIAPSLYFRQGDATKIADVQELVKTIVSKVPQQQVWGDLDAAVAWLEKSHAKQADMKRLGITGFCWGGTVVWMYAARQPKVRAGVAWYGKLATPANDLSPRTPLDVAPTLRAPVLGLYGGKDKSIPLEDVEKMRGALAQGKSGSEIVVYPEAEHGFHADYRPSYHEASAKDGWAKALAWLRKHGV